MKIDQLNIEKFAKDEYSNAAPYKEGINGRNLLVYGENRSGKTLTFNAILYCLLGSQETIDLSTGRGNRVTLSFDNDITFARGQPEANLDIDGDMYTGENAIDKFADLLGRPSFLKHHFLHSHTGRLPLSSLNKDERLSLVRSVSNNTRQREIELNRRAKDHASDLLVEAEDALRRTKEDQPDFEAQISSTERQLERHRTTQSLIESGQLERISEQLLRDEELETELDKLFSEKEAIRQQLNKLNKRKRRHEGYTKDVIDIIADAVNDFVCPACDRRVTSKKAKNRVKQGHCPYCGQKGSIEEIKERIGERVEGASEIVEDLDKEIDELEERRSEVSAEINAVKSQKPELSNLDAAIKRQLEEHDHDITRVEETVEEEIQAAEETLAELREVSEELEREVDALESRVTEYEESIETADSDIEQLEEASFTQEIQDFSEQWTENYRAMAGELGFELGIDPEGNVIAPGGLEDGPRRHYDRLGDLSDSEIRLMNISFVYTLNEKAVESGVTDWQVFVLDEPFSTLDAGSTETLIDFFLDADQQFILTSSNDEVTEYFDDYHTVTLERGQIQSELGEFL